jgi:hypothetical protein
MSNRQRKTVNSEKPATLHGVMQAAIAEGLRECYKPPETMSHGLLVLLMQLNEQAKTDTN